MWYVFCPIKDFMKVRFRFFLAGQTAFILQRIIYTVGIILLKSYFNFNLRNLKKRGFFIGNKRKQT